jgi:hypothetical protein
VATEGGAIKRRIGLQWDDYQRTTRNALADMAPTPGIAQEKDYIRKEAATLFRVRADTSDPELIEQQVSHAARL